MVCGASAQEFRALWADAFHSGYLSASQTTTLVAAARAAKCNAIVMQARKRGDAYYRNGLEPVATNVASGYDPLADLIAKAHDTSGGQQRIEVHAWVVAYNIWGNQTTPPSQPTHPYNLHPEWLSSRSDGVQYANGNFYFDPGHPEVQQHTYDVCMDIVNRYDVDGLHFDYIRYPDDSGGGLGNQRWGYNPTSVARYNVINNKTGTPASNDAAWLQWRRDQISAIVRKVYLNTWAVKPHVRVSGALICYDPAPVTDANWTNTAAYGLVLQDWRSWLQEGILDLGCQMVYKTNNTSLTNWTSFIRDRQYSRASAIGLGWYLNDVTKNIEQIGIARAASTGGNKAAGVLGYSYAVPNLDNETSQSSTWAQLAAGPFSSTVSVPSMPWKTNATRGSLMGTALAEFGGGAFDGATVTLTGPTSRTLKVDGSGWFGAVDLPVGTYNVIFTRPGYVPIAQTVTVTGGDVAEVPLTVQEKPFQIVNVSRNPAGTVLVIAWNSVPGRTYRVEAAPTIGAWSEVTSGVAAHSSGTNTFQWAVPANFGPSAFLRVIRE